MYKFSKRSLNNLANVHPDLAEVFHRVIECTPYDFVITEGLRSKETQAKYVKEGKSKTMNSKHLKQADGYSHALDIAVYDEWDMITWVPDYYEAVNDIVQIIADEMNVKITWGGNWRSFKDCPHFQIEVD